MNISNQYEYYTDSLKLEWAVALELFIQILEGKHPRMRRLLSTLAIPLWAHPVLLNGNVPNQLLTSVEYLPEQGVKDEA